MRPSRQPNVVYDSNYSHSRTGLLIILAIFICVALSSCGPDNTSIKGSKVSGTISVSGSTTMSNLMSIWCKGFSDIYHNTNCVVESFGSSRAPKDLIDGNVDIATMSEPMSAKDIQAFKNIYGYEPLEIKVAVDMIAVLVNIENPADCVTLGQLDGIYSNTYLCQESKDITTWGGLNLVGEWSNTPIKIYGRTPTSGTYSVFKNIALCGGSYKNTITELASSRDIVEFVTSDTTSIGYSGAGVLTPSVKALSIADSGNDCYAPIPKYAISKQYPLTRELYLYLKENPSKGMKKVTKKFMDYIFSKPGQEAVAEAGLVALPKDILQKQRQKLSN